MIVSQLMKAVEPELELIFFCAILECFCTQFQRLINYFNFYQSSVSFLGDLSVSLSLCLHSPADSKWSNDDN